VTDPAPGAVPGRTRSGTAPPLGERPLDLDAVDWEHTVFALLCPDALARGLARPAYDRFVAAGYTPVAAAVQWIRSPTLDEYNERNITEVWKAYLYRLIDLVFAYGPTVGLLLRDDAAAADSHPRLRPVKGASRPADALPGSIRGDLRAINVSLDLVHTSDTPGESRTESAAFVAADSWRAVLDPAGVRDWVGLVEAGYRREERGFDEVLAGVRARVAGAVWTELSRAGRETALRWSAGDVGTIAAPGAGAALAAELPAGHPLRAFLAGEFRPDQPRVDVDRAVHTLGHYGATLDRWEHLVLASSQRFDPLRTVVTPAG
jgi:nucleoside diphosphate kinase